MHSSCPLLCGRQAEPADSLSSRTGTAGLLLPFARHHKLIPAGTLPALDYISNTPWGKVVVLPQKGAGFCGQASG